MARPADGCPASPVNPDKSSPGSRQAPPIQIHHTCAYRIITADEDAPHSRPIPTTGFKGGARPGDTFQRVVSRAPQQHSYGPRHWVSRTSADARVREWAAAWRQSEVGQADGYRLFVRIASSVQIENVLHALAAARPVFHSEADFQLAFAWQVQLMDPAMRVRLETRPAPGLHLDLAFGRPDLGRSSAVELKYLTRKWIGEVYGERYELKDHGAQDNRSYDVVKDICRVEQFVVSGIVTDGTVIVLTNDGAYWRPPKVNDVADAAAFRTGEGVVLNGRRHWVKDRTGSGSERESPLELRGRYVLHWADYSTLPSGGVAGTMRQLVVPISGGG
jgi:hypothetical protein